MTVQLADRPAPSPPADGFNAWNRLLAAAGCDLPTLRGECLERFAATFLRPGELKILSVKREDELVAALPVALESRLGVFGLGTLPVNPWMTCGDLAVDRRVAEDDRVSGRLADQLLALRWTMLDFQWIEQSPAWERLVAALAQRGCTIEKTLQFETGEITIDGSWDAYFAGLSKSFRKQMRSSLRNLEERGPVVFERHHDMTGVRFDELFDEALAIEHRGWKGTEATSLLSQPEACQFFLEVARELNRAGILELHFLRVGGLAVAFEIGYRSATTWYSHKVGYDPDFTRYSPGQLLMYLQLQHWFAGGQVQRVDTMGLLTLASAKWCNHIRPRYRIRVLRPGILPRLAWHSVRKVSSVVRRFRSSGIRH
jgi:hypothetical protein